MRNVSIAIALVTGTVALASGADEGAKTLGISVETRKLMPPSGPIRELTLHNGLKGPLRLFVLGEWSPVPFIRIKYTGGPLPIQEAQHGPEGWTADVGSDPIQDAVVVGRLARRGHRTGELARFPGQAGARRGRVRLREPALVRTARHGASAASVRRPDSRRRARAFGRAPGCKVEGVESADWRADDCRARRRSGARLRTRRAAPGGGTVALDWRREVPSR